MKKVFYTCFDSSIGKLYIKATEKGICSISISSFISNSSEAIKKKYETHLLKRCLRELKEYFQGKRKLFAIPFDFLSGTEFEKKVWNTLLEIPYGTTSTYKLIAKKIGKPKSCRAVGNAVGKNPIPIIIPCHRVIREDGKLGGFSSGIGIKKKLLKLEKVKPPIKNL